MSVSDVMARVRHQLAEQDISQASFARQIEVSPQTLSAWMSGRNRPGVDDVIRMCEALRVSPSWLLTGTETSEHQSLVSDDFGCIPLFDVQASCGNGYQVSQACVCDLIRVNRPWIARHCGVVNQHALNLIAITGDSMTPTLKDGDFVVIDTSAKTISTDAMYAFNLDDDLYVKRLQRVGRSLRVISDNPIYTPYILTADELDHGFAVHGRVVTTCQINRV